MKSNLDLRSWLQTVLTDNHRSHDEKTLNLPRTGSTAIGGASLSANDFCDRNVRNSSTKGSSEGWWDRPDKMSEDEENENTYWRNKEVPASTGQYKVRHCIPEFPVLIFKNP